MQPAAVTSPRVMQSGQLIEKGEDIMSKYRLQDLEQGTALDLELTAQEFGELKRFLKELKKPRENIDFKLILERYNSVCKNLRPRQG